MNLRGLWHARFGWIGPEGRLMLVASLLLITLTVGLSLLLAIGRVVVIAGRTRTTGETPRTIAVAGRAPGKDGKVCGDFAQRLERARALWTPGATIIVLGGQTRLDAESEAQLGHAYLQALGVPDACLRLEEQSRHTIENLRYLRQLLHGWEDPEPVLVTARYHAARCAAIARGMGLRLPIMAAEPSLALDLRTLGLVFVEGFLLHWYHVGHWLALRLTHQQALARIT